MWKNDDNIKAFLGIHGLIAEFLEDHNEIPGASKNAENIRTLLNEVATERIKHSQKEG